MYSMCTIHTVLLHNQSGYYNSLIKQALDLAPGTALKLNWVCHHHTCLFRAKYNSLKGFSARSRKLIFRRLAWHLYTRLYHHKQSRLGSCFNSCSIGTAINLIALLALSFPLYINLLPFATMANEIWTFAPLPHAWFYKCGKSYFRHHSFCPFRLRTYCMMVRVKPLHTKSQFVLGMQLEPVLRLTFTWYFTGRAVAPLIWCWKTVRIIR